jgi:hypothetical protein
MNEKFENSFGRPTTVNTYYQNKCPPLVKQRTGKAQSTKLPFNLIKKNQLSKENVNTSFSPPT